MNTHRNHTTAAESAPVWALFDPPASADPSPAPAPADRPAAVFQGPAINDMDLVRTVLEHASEPGYVLIGDPEHVWRRNIRRGPDVQRVSAGEADAVRQLLDQRFLTRGGTRPVRLGRHDNHGTSVLLTAAARARLRRWRALTDHPPQTAAGAATGTEGR